PTMGGSGAIEAHCPHSAPDYKLSIATGERLQVRMPGNEFANPRFKARRRGWPDLEAEAAQNATQAHLDIMKFYLHQLARGEQRPRLLRCNRLAMHRSEPAQPHQLRDSARVITVGLHRHRLERVAHMACLQ